MDDALRQQATRAREAIAAGHLRGAALLDQLLAVPFRERDVWVDEALGLDDAPDDVAGLPPGTVPYLPCGVDAILHTVRDAPVGVDDVFVDLGAGLGRVAVLVHLLTGAPAIGVELQAPLVAQARALVGRLALPDVVFCAGDAAVTEVDNGTVFFVYASFGPAALRGVLQWLERRAAHKPLVVCAVGFDIHGQAWLRPRSSTSPELALYDSGSPAS